MQFLLLYSGDFFFTQTFKETMSLKRKKEGYETGGTTKSLLQCLACIALLTIIVVAILVLVVYVFARATSAVCDTYDITTETYLQMCRELECEFDTSKCSNICPFGYEKYDNCPVSCLCTTESQTFQGDIRFYEPQLPQMLKQFGVIQQGFTIQSGSHSPSYPTWRFKVAGRIKVPYRLKIKNSFLPNIRKAIQLYKNKTCIDFIPHTNEDVYIQYEDANSCSSTIGRVPQLRQRRITGKMQLLTLAPNCGMQLGTVLHEMAHALSFHHEHNRPDRDDYVDILMENVVPHMASNFWKLENALDLGTPLDTDSMLMYDGRAASIKPFLLFTIVDKINKNPIIAQRNGFSQLDIQDVNTLYCGGLATGGSPSPAAASTPTTPRPVNTTRHPVNTTRRPVYTTRRPSVGAPAKHHAIHSTNANPLGGSVYLGGFTWHKPAAGLSDVNLQQSVNLDWGAWSAWSSCQGRCGKIGKVLRTRTCIGGTINQCETTYPLSGARDINLCEGKPCNDGSEPAWSKWTSTMACSKTCGNGFVIRTRKCEGYKIGHSYCKAGKRVSVEDCNTQACESKAEWSTWSAFNGCSRTCGIGTRAFVRYCVDETGYILGAVSAKCRGLKYVWRRCAEQPCPANDIWNLQYNDGNLPTGNSVFDSEAKTLSNMLCVNSAQWIFGDFNGDGRSDVMCRQDNYIYKVRLFTSSGTVDEISSEGPIDGCGRGLKYSADFNGDGLDDLLCQDKDNRFLSIKLSNGNFTSPALYVGSFCSSPQDRILLIDSNGDGKSDIFCSNPTYGDELMMNRYNES